MPCGDCPTPYASSTSSAASVETLKYLRVKESFFVATTRSQSLIEFFFKKRFVRYLTYLSMTVSIGDTRRAGMAAPLAESAGRSHEHFAIALLCDCDLVTEVAGLVVDLDVLL